VIPKCWIVESTKRLTARPIRKTAKKVAVIQRCYKWCLLGHYVHGGMSVQGERRLLPLSDHVVVEMGLPWSLQEPLLLQEHPIAELPADTTASLYFLRTVRSQPTKQLFSRCQSIC